MITKEAKDALYHNEAYCDFLEQVYMLRESLIGNMHDVSTDSIQQISGRILQCDEILTMGGWNMIQLRGPQ
jgi:hypothetical protein